MNTRTIVLLILTGLIAGTMPAQQRRVGIGVTLGAPTGLSIKYWESEKVAIQGYIGGGFGGVTFGADYLRHSNEFKDPQWPFYYGFGAFLGPAAGGPTIKTGSTALGVRGVMGVDYLSPNRRFDISFEIGPALLLSPDVGIGVGAGLGLRFYP